MTYELVKKPLSFKNKKLISPPYIFSVNLNKTASILMLFLSCVFNGYAQYSKAVDFYFETDTISAKQGESFINFLVLENLSGTEITVENIAPEIKYAGLLLSPQKSYVLNKDEKKRLPIKFLANTDFMKMESQKITFQMSYFSNEKQETKNASFFIDKDEERQIALYSFSRENYINPSMRETTISVFVENRSYSRRSIKLIFQSQYDELNLHPKAQTENLEAREKKLVEVKAGLRRNSSNFPEYTVQVEAVDLITNEKVGSTSLRIIALSNNRQIMRGSIHQPGQNFVELAYNENSSGQNYIQLRGNTGFSSGKETEFRFNITEDYFFQEGQYNLYDTWLEVERKGSLLRLGNVYGNDYNYSVSGRGGKVNLALDNNEEIEVFALENNYNLYGTYYPQNRGETILGAKYEFGTKNSFNGKISYLFDHNPRLDINSHLAHWKSSFTLDSIHNLQVETGVSHERDLIFKEEKGGASAGLNYSAYLGEWSFQSTNSYATKNYVGLNRGSFNLLQNIGYKLAPSQQIFLQYQNAQIAPEYLSYQNFVPGSTPYYRPEYFYGSQAVQIGYQFPIYNWNVFIAPKVEKQKNLVSFDFNELLSYRLRSNIGTSFQNQSLNVSMEYSYSKINTFPEWFYSFYSTLSYRYKNFSVNGSLKINPDDVIELNSYNQTSDDFINYSIYASYNFQTFNKTLSGSFAAGTHFSGLYRNENQNFSGNLEYKISSNWATTAYGNYSIYKSTQTYGFERNYYQFRIGIKKYFTRATLAGNYQVSLQLFEDTNANGILDTDEKVLANEPVRLDDFVAITDSKGKVNFQNVPKGNYTLKIQESAEARLMIDPILFVDQNLKLQIGLIENNKVTGRLVEIKQIYDVLETNVRGIIVYAKNEEGEVQSTVVNQNNEFEFFLKDGIYHIYIENDRYKFENPIKTIDVKRSINPDVLLFEYSKKDTTIKVKKF